MNVRLWDVSAGGCLLEFREFVPVGTVGVLAADLDGRRHLEWFRICRVHDEEGRRSRCLVGAEFLTLSPTRQDSLRAAIARMRGPAASAGIPTLAGRSSGDPGNGRFESSCANRRGSQSLLIDGRIGRAVARWPAAGVPEARKGVVHMKALVFRLVRNDEGQDLIEYVLIGTLVSVAVVIGAGALGVNLNTWYQNMADWVAANSTV
jgi:Flp pilus assembly pilin Flp